MFPSVEVIFANLGKVGELREVGNGNHVINISVVENFRKKVGGEWVDDVPVWRDVTIWGPEAVNFANSDIKPGAPLMIVGTRRARMADAYTTSDGREIPERSVESIQAKHVGFEINRWNVITGTDKADNSSMSGGGAQTSSKPAKKKETTASIFDDGGDVAPPKKKPDTSGSIFDEDF